MAADDKFVTKEEFQEAVEKMIAKIGEIGKKMETDMGTLRQEQGRLSSSINNVQTQVLEKQGKFDSTSSSGGGSHPLPPPVVHKLRFPKYDGSDDPLGWLHKCDQFFHTQGTPADLKVWTASFYLEGAAHQWYYRLQKNQGAPTWTKFVEAINMRFGPPVRSNTLGELAHLRRTGTVDEYQDQFLKLLARCDSVTEPQQIALFTAGLGEPMSTDVEMQKPDTFEEAMALARGFERCTKIDEEIARSAGHTVARTFTPSRTATAPPPRTPATPSATGSTPVTPGAPLRAPRGSRFTRLSPEEMEQRRIEGRCFNCPEKFTPGHHKQCSMKGIYLMELDSDGETEDNVDDNIQISSHAITGVQTGGTV